MQTFAYLLILLIYFFPPSFVSSGLALCSFIFWQIPKDILLEVLGPSKVYKEVIKKVINSAISEYVKKVSIDSNHLLYAPLVLYLSKSLRQSLANIRSVPHKCSQLNGTSSLKLLPGIHRYYMMHLLYLFATSI